MRHPEHPRMGDHVIISGRTMGILRDDYGLSDDVVASWASSAGTKVSRVDFAVDVYDSGMDLDEMWYSLEQGKAKTRASHSRIQSGDDRGYTVYVGSTKTRTKLVRAYDKAKEQGDFESDWKRLEMECRRPVSDKLISSGCDEDYSVDWIIGAIRGHVDFPDWKLWNEIMSAERVDVPTPRHEHGDTMKWILEQCVPAMAREIHRDAENSKIIALELEKRLSELRRVGSGLG